MERFNNGKVSLKDAYQFIHQAHFVIPWAVSTWSTYVPSFHSLLTWRLLNYKLPTDEKLQCIGINMIFMCSLCKTNQETMNHLFFSRSFATNLWTWLCKVLNIYVHIYSSAIWESCSKASFPQGCFTIQSYYIFLVNAIRSTRNSARFNGQPFQFHSICNHIIVHMQMSFSKSNLTYKHYWFDFVVLKSFSVPIHHTRAPIIKYIFLESSSSNWIKCNVDEAYSYNLGSEGCGGIFRLNSGLFTLAFVEPLPWLNSLLPEFCGVLCSIEIAKDKCWKHLLGEI